MGAGAAVNYSDLPEGAKILSAPAAGEDYSDLPKGAKILHAPNASLAPPAGAPPKALPEPSALNRFGTAFGAATANLIPTREGLSHAFNDKPVSGEGDESILPEAVSRAGRGIYRSTIDAPARRMEEGDIAGGIGEFIPNALAVRGMAGRAPEAIPARQIGRVAGTVGAGMSAAGVDIGDAALLRVPSKIARATGGVIRGLRGAPEAPPVYPGATFPKTPVPEIIPPAGKLYHGAPAEAAADIEQTGLHSDEGRVYVTPDREAALDYGRAKSPSGQAVVYEVNPEQTPDFGYQGMERRSRGPIPPEALTRADMPPVQPVVDPLLERLRGNAAALPTEAQPPVIPRGRELRVGGRIVSPESNLEGALKRSVKRAKKRD